MNTFTAAEVCKELGIQDSTLRKYSLLLDKEGVSFERHKNNRRIYTETHIKTLKRTLELMRNDDITLEIAIKRAVNELRVHPVIEEKSVTEEALQRNNSDITAILIEEIRELKAQLADQEDRQKKRDSLFVEALEEMQKEIRGLKEQQKQLMEPAENDDVVSNNPTEKGLDSNEVFEAPSNESNKKKGFFARLFNK